MKYAIIYIPIAVLFLVLSIGCMEKVYSKYGIPSDNIVEEYIEEVAKEKTGVDIDISPLSPEYGNPD